MSSTVFIEITNVNQLPKGLFQMFVIMLNNQMGFFGSSPVLNSILK